MKKIYLITLVCGIIVAFIVNFYFIYNKNNTDALNDEKNIEEKYGDYVMTNKNAKLYIKDDSFKEFGSVSKDLSLELEKIDGNYFKIKNIDYYIYYKDVDKSDVLFYNDRYKEYVLWNENVITKDETSFYDESNKLIFKINKSFNLPVIIKDKDRYGVEFNNNLYYVKDIKEIVEHDNTSVSTRTNIRTLTYHTVYDPNKEECTSIEICHPIKQFEEQMKYLHDNDYLTLTMEELEMFLDKKIRIPTKSIAITLDDGIFLDNSIPIIEKYKIYATFFIITSKTDVSKYFISSYARFESHSDDLHNNYQCPKNRASSQGGQMLCEKEEKIIKDLKLSQEKLNGSYYFAYPFFDFNLSAISALKKAGFKMAFIGQWDSNGYSTYDTERFMIRRKTIFGNLKLNNFIDYLK